MKELRVLLVGDIIGQAGIRAMISLLPALKRDSAADLIIVNGENAADGFGMTPEIVQQFFASGIHVITSGNHIWHHRELYPVLDSQPNLLRPYNYPSPNPGKGMCVVEVKGQKVGVLNLQGRTRMWAIDCPFKKGKEAVRKLRNETKCIIVDMHADAVEEKEALAWYLDGEISALIGTHTHIPTADERILPKGTAYLSDVGASGPADSIIGFNTEIGIQRSLSQMPLKNEVSSNPAYLRAVLMTIDPQTGKSLSIERMSSRSLV